MQIEFICLCDDLSVLLHTQQRLTHKDTLIHCLINLNTKYPAMTRRNNCAILHRCSKYISAVYRQLVYPPLPGVFPEVDYFKFCIIISLKY